MSVDYQKQPKSKTGLQYLGLESNDNIFWNLSPAELYEQVIKREEAVLTKDHALRVLTGKFTGRSPMDKFIVDQPSIHNEIDWGEINQPISEEVFDRLYKKAITYLQDKDLFVKDLFCGADENNRLNVRVVSEAAYHALFAHNMFIRPSAEELANHEPEFTVLAAPHLKAIPDEDGTRSSTFILCNFDKKIILIGGTLYSGELKKGIFSVMNYLLPKKGVMAMHCSANHDENGKTAVFFGLSGTGKTTLSADPDKVLIGDDEHGWSDDGVFNFEGGCYAKTINLSKENEPLIHATTKMPGTILENVVLDEKRRPDFDDVSLTQNTRCSYPLDFIPNASETGRGDHPENIIFLTADAFGVLPPISRLTPGQAMYHFISGYTAKVAGTERGVTEPQATFSACFGAPFMPLHPTVYAELLAKKIRKHGSKVWLVNTGWTGGAYGTGHRMKLAHTRRMLSEAIAGNLDKEEFIKDPVFGLAIPKKINGVPNEVLIPRNTWKDKAAYDAKAEELAQMFVENFSQFEEEASEEILSAAPKITVSS
ncbi:phosphoenolpyruvate carboxykinase (ATP) [Gracilimonas mengyeensis]|uniref:Phosphoenolpyruvate carboxykinase (ATP) n=1 Tax=Gracilimonas mengyeensis TaxID=1302730 RepID=A0A521FNC2_9BACT|nr:phosphoenolpyruvate carboxykinase (ATP) [Gracilimonas mengyeensis]SMO97070.1 phosphoenolpyruvate carboxykinase (ATP) [Gracilimonas mengyeensis]